MIVVMFLSEYLMCRTLKSKHLELLLIVTTVNYDLGNCKKRTFSLEAFAFPKKIPPSFPREPKAIQSGSALFL